MAFSARTRPKGRRSHSAPPGLDTTALRLDSTGHRADVAVDRAGGPSALVPIPTLVDVDFAT